MAIRLHVVAILNYQFALTGNDCPNETAGEGAFERTVANGTAGVGICFCGTEVRERVIGVWRGDVVGADVLCCFMAVSFVFFELQMCDIAISRPRVFLLVSPGAFVLSS